MRFCLRCRNFSGGGPICTRCNASFGGRRCLGRQHHLNPFDALFCNFCGTPDLLEGARSIPLGWISRLLIVAALYFGGRWLLETLVTAPNSILQNYTGYQHWGICLIQYLGHILMLFFLFYFLSVFIPGEAGKQFRSALLSVAVHTVKFSLKIVEKVIGYTGILLLKAAGIETKKEKKKK